MYKYVLSFLLVALGACDSGDIVEKTQASATGRVAKVSVVVSGLDQLDSKYSLALASYRTGNNYAVSMRSLTSVPQDGEEVTLVLSNISNDVNTIELVIADRLRQRVVSLASVNMDDYAASSDTIRLTPAAQNVAPLAVLQRQLFNAACIQCHGGNGGAGAASLNLTEGNAQSQLVNVASTRKEGMLRVKSGDAQSSLIHQILAEGGENILHVNHTEILNNQFKDNVAELRTFIDNWINKLE